VALWSYRTLPPRHRSQAFGPAFHIALALGVSLALSLLVATGMVYAKLWNPAAGIALLSGLTLALLVIPRWLRPSKIPAPSMPSSGPAQERTSHARH